MDRPSFDILGFLDECSRPVSVATVTRQEGPALAMMWFVLDDGRLWFHTPEDSNRPSPFLRAAGEGQDVAAMIATFNPPTDVRQVRTTGPARLEADNSERVRRIYSRYVETWTLKWERQATASHYHLWSMSPQRGMAVAYRNLEDSPAFRWSDPSRLLRL
ncbi:MAG: pyridoxamine 5'-phosphate oxidase family protein [Nocardioidaceae bacterium]